MSTDDQSIDITSEVCPMTFVRTKLKLERMQPRDVLHVRLHGKGQQLRLVRYRTPERQTGIFPVGLQQQACDPGRSQQLGHILTSPATLAHRLECLAMETGGAIEIECAQRALHEADHSLDR